MDRTGFVLEVHRRNVGEEAAGHQTAKGGVLGGRYNGCLIAVPVVLAVSLVI
jgi:hypothetical protein